MIYSKQGIDIFGQFRWTITSLLLLIITMAACRKTPLPPVPDPCPAPCDTLPTSKLDVVWMVPLRPDSSVGASRFPVIDGDQVIYSHQFATGGEQFYALDAVTGQRRWYWTDNKTGSITNQQYGLHTTGSHLIASMGSTYFIDRNTGLTDWWIYIDGAYCASTRSMIIGDFFYQNISNCNAASWDFDVLRRTSLDLTMSWDTIFSTVPQDNDGYFSDIEPPALWIHPSGDSILVMKNRLLDKLNKDRVDLWAWNLSSDSLLWKITGFDPTGNCRIGPPTIYQDKVYVFGGSTVFCFDLHSATKIWSHSFTGMAEGLLDAQPLIQEGILFVKTSTQTAYAFNPETGSILWQRKDNVGTCRSLLAYHDGIVYYTGFDLHPGTLYALDIHTGKTIWAEKSPLFGQNGFSDASFAYNGVAIDPVRKVLYASDYYFAYCIKLPE